MKPFVHALTLLALTTTPAIVKAETPDPLVARATESLTAQACASAQEVGEQIIGAKERGFTRAQLLSRLEGTNHEADESADLIIIASEAMFETFINNLYDRPGATHEKHLEALDFTCKMMLPIVISSMLSE